MAFLPFFGAQNLVESNLVELAPWEFCVDDKDNALKKLSKEKRRAALLRPSTVWNVYTSIRGYARNQRISKTNPPAGGRGLVADYDMVSDLETIMKYIEQKPEWQRPNLIEKSLGNKVRLVWNFEREVLFPSTAFCHDFLEKMSEKLGVANLLAGYDPASLKSTEMWTNGGTWYDVNPKPLSWEYCFGVVCEVSKKTSLFNNGEIPIETIYEEVKKRFPNRWQGDFKLDAQGVRFWEETADNETGAQVKPDGMLCFTGNEPFMKWEAIFGRPWCEEQRVLNLGRAAESIYFDGKNYWEFQHGRWESSVRADIILRLKGRGLSDRCAKGATQSDVERVLDHIQVVNRIQGAAPLVNYPKGIMELDGRRVLNIADLRPTQPAPGPTGKPELDFPWLWAFLNGLFPHPELLPLEHFLAWLQRSYRVVLEHRRFMGQAVFICGPKNNGKTLLCLRVVKPLMGDKIGNPIDYMLGDTNFNSDLFSAALLAVNDEDSASNETSRKRMLAKLKGLCVNPVHKFHAKFQEPVTIDWTGRIFMTLNNDAGSVGILMDVESNTQDRLSYFASQPYSGEFPPQEELEATLEKELPFFAHWLLKIYVPKPEVLTRDRMGVKSYFDPEILELSHQQTFSSNLSELLVVWQRVDAYWGDEKTDCWSGTPTALLTCLQTCTDTQGIARDWSQQKIAKSLTDLAKQEGSGIAFAGSSREFKIGRLA